MGINVMFRPADEYSQSIQTHQIEKEDTDEMIRTIFDRGGEDHGMD